MMLGGYVTITSVNYGINIFLSILIIAPATVGLIGLVVERLVIRNLYSRLVDTMLATWGLSLFFIGVVTMIFGNTTTGISTPIPGFSIGTYQVGGYNIFIIMISAFLLISAYFILKKTRAGLIARGSMQSAEIASALGYSPDRVYMMTFFCGSALTGLAGAVLAPLVGLVPSSGGAYIAKAFITVIAGGPSLVVGLVSSASLFGIVNQLFTFLYSPVVGEVALLVAAVILLRLLPRGITGSFFKDRL